MKTRKHLIQSKSTTRDGTTLSEVLVSLLVMSIGVVSLITLFPISVLRSAQATHLTNSANLRYNVEAMLGARPDLYTIAKSWQAGQSYAVGDFVTPMELTAMKAPPVVFQCTQAGISGIVEPNWDYRDGNLTRNDGSWNQATQTYDNPVIWTTIRLKNYVVDPLGEVLMAGSPSDAVYRQTNRGDFFGNDGSIPTRLIRAFSGGVANEVAADDMATLPDSWINQAESTRINYDSTSGQSCTLGDLQEFLTPVTNGYPNTRIVFFNDTGKVSHVRQIASTSANNQTAQTVNWIGSLPSGFNPVKARIDTKSRRYTWMLSIRRSFGGASLMDVVVFFKRPFSPKDEQLYPATFQTGAIDVSNSDPQNDRWANFVRDPGTDGFRGSSGDDNGVYGDEDIGELGWPGSDDTARNWVVLQWNTSGDKPFVKKGGFITDAENLRWYRITDYFEGPTPESVMTLANITTSIAAYTPDAPLAGHRSILVRVENSILQNGTQPTGGPNVSAIGGTPRGRAMLMRGIIDVYPIRTHLTWEE